MTEPPICKVCKMAAVEGCRNTLRYPSGGSILVHEGERLMSVECPNMRVVTLRQRLTAIDPQLLTIAHRSETPLYKRGEFDRTRENLFIRHAHWHAFLSHFKWVIGSKSSGFFVRIVTDMTLLNVFLGNAAYKNRLASQRLENGELLISNSLEDLLSSPDLVVIRLGYVVHANRAAPNVLREAIGLRLGLGKPTWLVEPLEQNFVPLGMACCDDSVTAVVKSSFEDLHLDERHFEPAYEEDEDGVTVRGSLQEQPIATEDFEEDPEDEASPADQSTFDAAMKADVDSIVAKPRKASSRKGRRYT